MCFSTSASFGAGAVLAVIGVVTIKKAKAPNQVLFAGIPFLFSLQQIDEGFLWLALTNNYSAAMKEITTYIFLFIAQVIWPLLVPLSISLLEKNEKRKIFLQVLVFVGAIISVYLTYCIINYPVNSKIIGYHISYSQNYPASLSIIGGILYVLATVFPPLISSFKRMWYLGLSILISYIMTRIFYTDYIVSVWCFFASVISISVYAVMTDINNTKTA